MIMVTLFSERALWLLLRKAVCHAEIRVFPSWWTAQMLLARSHPKGTLVISLFSGESFRQTKPNKGRSTSRFGKTAYRCEFAVFVWKNKETSQKPVQFANLFFVVNVLFREKHSDLTKGTPFFANGLTNRPLVGLVCWNHS